LNPAGFFDASRIAAPNSNPSLTKLIRNGIDVAKNIWKCENILIIGVQSSNNIFTRESLQSSAGIHLALLLLLLLLLMLHVCSSFTQFWEPATAAGQPRAHAVCYSATAAGQQRAFVHSVWYPATALQWLQSDWMLLVNLLLQQGSGVRIHAAFFPSNLL
jgi:hypothetical protein